MKPQPTNRRKPELALRSLAPVSYVVNKARTVQNSWFRLAPVLLSDAGLVCWRELPRQFGGSACVAYSLLS